jgi:hypothetical protein
MVGFTEIYVDNNGKPTENETQWIASAFVFLFWTIHVGKIRHINDKNK